MSMLRLQTVKKKEQRFLQFGKEWILNEQGMIYPHILLILVLIMAASVSIADSFVSKWKTADYVTDYYELRIVELMAVRNVVAQSEPDPFFLETNIGTTHVTISEAVQNERRVRIETTHQDGVFWAVYHLHSEDGSILKRTEYY